VSIGCQIVRVVSPKSKRGCVIQENIQIWWTEVAGFAEWDMAAIPLLWLLTPGLYTLLVRQAAYGFQLRFVPSRLHSRRSTCQISKSPFTESVLRMHAVDSQSTTSYFIGVDLGTSGARISLIEPKGNDSIFKSTNSEPVEATSYQEIYSHAVGWNSELKPIPSLIDSSHTTRTTFVHLGSYDEPQAWSDAVEYLFDGMVHKMSRSNMQQVRAICISGTSSSCLLVRAIPSTDGSFHLHPTRGPKARMYNYAAQNCTKILQQQVPARHTAQSVTSTLAKLISWRLEQPLDEKEQLCHQADYIIRQWCLLQEDDTDDAIICSDWHNCLKLGYDVRALEWPEWLRACLHNNGIVADQVLPRTVVSPGAPLGTIRPDLAKKYGFSLETVLVGGTTDSNAAFFAATQGMCAPGVAVTSLGSTVALKHLSTAYVEDADRGVYSHRFPSAFESDGDKALWLVGGASNVGCAVLRQLNFTNDELDELSTRVDPNTDSPYAYYPLPSVGERFPIADRDRQPVLHPIPLTRQEYLHGLLQGIGDVERDGYLALGALGAHPGLPAQIWTCGGGSRNAMWNQMRERRLREAFANFATYGSTNATNSSLVTVQRAKNVEASYGAAILAAASFRK
jgi:D-ribulokinase